MKAQITSNTSADSQRVARTADVTAYKPQFGGETVVYLRSPDGEAYYLHSGDILNFGEIEAAITAGLIPQAA